LRSNAIARREPESLAPIEVAGLPDELVPVADELNGLLLRVRRAFEREQQFIDAAAHEIRTPIAAVQLHVQNAMRARDDGERTQSMAEASAALKRTTLLAEQLLTFSRLASKTDLALHDPVSLTAVCREVIELQETLLARRGRSLGLSAPRDYRIEGDPFRLEQVLRNLIDNASQHGAAAGDIDVAISSDGRSVSLQVSNDGEPVPEDKAEQVFRPCYRLQSAAVPCRAGRRARLEHCERHRQPARGHGVDRQESGPAGLCRDGTLSGAGCDPGQRLIVRGTTALRLRLI